MAISKTGSRKIVVDGVSYRWNVRPKPTINIQDLGGPLTFAAERMGTKGSILVVALPQDRLIIYRGESYERGQTPATPRQVADAIRKAIRAGWNPAKRGKPFQMDMLHDR
jgi:hypothetical protein